MIKYWLGISWKIPIPINFQLIFTDPDTWTHLYHFSMIFKLYIQVLLVSKSSDSLWFSKIISNFWKNDICAPFPPEIFIYYPILMKFCMKHLCSIVSWQLGKNWNFSQMGGLLHSPPPHYNVEILIYCPILLEILYEKSLFGCWLKFKTNCRKRCI